MEVFNQVGWFGGKDIGVLICRFQVQTFSSGHLSEHLSTKADGRTFQVWANGTHWSVFI